MGAENIEKTLACVQKAITEDRYNQKAYQALGICCAEQGKFDEALEALTNAVTINPFSQAAWYDLACVYALKGDKGKMLENLQKSVEIEKKVHLSQKEKPDDKTGYMSYLRKGVIRVNSYSALARIDKYFADFVGSPEFDAICPEIPEELRSIVEALIEDNVYSALVEGEEILPKAKDKSAILQSMKYAIDSILSDLDEHGEANQSLYGDYDKEYFVDYKKKSKVT